MKTKLGLVIILVEAASITSLLFLLKQANLPPTFDLFLVFSLPISFGLHVVEEFFFPGGGSAWFALNHPEYSKAYTPAYFFKVNAIPLVLSLLVSLGTFDFAGGFAFFGLRAWLAFAVFQATNAIFHLRGTIATRRYSPGLGTGMLMYLPLTIISYAFFLQTGLVDIVSALVCIGIGACIQPVLDSIKKSSIAKQNSTGVESN